MKALMAMCTVLTVAVRERYSSCDGDRVVDTKRGLEGFELRCQDRQGPGTRIETDVRNQICIGGA